MQFSGIDMHLMDEWEPEYTKDYAGRGAWVQHIGVPFDLSLAFHSDAGVTTDDSTVGTLAIYTYRDKKDNRDKGKTTYKNGEDRMNGRIFSGMVQDEIVAAVRDGYDSQWNRRQLWNRNYSETRSPGVPAMILEILSHQNLADMKYGLDPSFRFTVSRAVYKGILKYLSSRYGCAYAVQPLPVKAFAAVLQDGKAQAALPAAEQDLRTCPNFLMRKFFAERFIVTAKLSFRPNPARKDRGETAGFLVMGDAYAGLRLTDTPDGAKLEWITGQESGGTVPLTLLPYRFDRVDAGHASPNVPPVRYAPVPEAVVWVRLDVRATPEEGNVPAAQCRFSYSLDGVNYVRAGETFVAKEGKWIGARYGFFCSRPSDRKDLVLRPAMARFSTRTPGRNSPSTCPHPVMGACSGV
jgi:hypothetical protein